MGCAKIVQKEDSGGYSGVFALALKGMRILPAEERSDYEKFVTLLLGRQMDFIHSIHGLGPGFSIELRYLFDPREPYLINVYFLIHFQGEAKSEVVGKADRLAGYFLNLLRINHHLHEFELVEDDDRLAYLVSPFDFRHVVEIMRREDWIPLDAMPGKASRKMGFGLPAFPEATASETSSGSHIYYIYPYVITLDNMERLCNALLVQEHPYLVSICLKPYEVTAEDERNFEERIYLCEKFAQLEIHVSDSIEHLTPFLKKQANTLHDRCVKTLMRLQDAAFLMKVQIAGACPVPPEVATIAGCTFTEHTGHPRQVFKKESEVQFSGGYECYSPQNEAQRQCALKNLQRMDFEPWMPGAADAVRLHWRYLFDVSQAVSALRLPLPIAAEFPGINTYQYFLKAAPSDLPENGLLLGEHVHIHQHRKVFMKPGDRRRHTYIVGQTGTGKSTLFLQMILQDLQAGKGIGLIDPHGELIEEVLTWIPESRKSDVIYVNPGDFEYPIGINMMECRDPFEKDFSVNYLLDVFDTLYDLKLTGGPIFEMYMRNALLLLMEQPSDFRPTILEVPRLFQERDFRKWLLGRCRNTYVRNFWEREAHKAGGDASLENVAPYITSKLSRFVYNDLVRGILGQRGSTIDFRKVIDEGKILLVNLKKGLLGDINSHFLGMILVGKLLTATLGRCDIRDKRTLKDFFLYVDEFQNLATQTFVSILSEARKYRLSLIITNQYISQLRENIVRGIFGNTGTLVSFRIGHDDAEFLSREFGAVVSQNDLMGLSNWNAYIRMLVDGNVTAPFNIRTLLPEKADGYRDHSADIIALSRQRFGRPREEVEKEIQHGWVKE